MANTNSKTTALLDVQATGIATGEEEETQVPPSPVNRRGHSLCGCCCDTRRAVIVTNIVPLTFAVANVLVVLYFPHPPQDSKTDPSSSESDDQENVLWAACNNILHALNIFLFGVIGAITFNIEMVAWALYYYVLGLNLLVAVFSGFAIYTHALFIREMLWDGGRIIGDEGFLATT